MHKKRRWKRTAAGALAILLCLILPGFRNDLKVVRYTVDADAVTSPVRIVLVTDLHACAYGTACAN